MWRKVVAIVAAMAGAVTFVPSRASARGFRGGGRGWGWSGPAIGLGVRLGLAGARYYGGYYGGGPAYGYGGYRDCWPRP
jgi:hypothetical protein